MDDAMVYTYGAIALVVGAGLIIAIITFSRFLARRTVGSGSSNWAWNQLGYRSMGAIRYRAGSVSTHYVRNYRNLEIHYLMFIKSGFGKSEYSSAWVCPLAENTRFGLQVIEAGIADPSLVAKASRAISPAKYGWEQKFQGQLRSGDHDLDDRFAMFSTNAESAQSFLAAPGVRNSLLGLKHVDLTLAESEARLDDPFLVNTWGLDGQPLVDIHNQVADLLSQVAGAAR